MGILVVGFCAAFPFRHGEPPREWVVRNRAERAVTLGEGVSLQVPGQTSPAQLPPRSLHPGPIEGTVDEAGESDRPATSDKVVGPTQPPPLPDQYRPLFSAPAGNTRQGAPPASSESPRRDVPAFPASPPRQHTLRDGDTLESLALRFLGEPGRADEIFQANRDVLSDPNLLPVGTRIVIPRRGRAGETPAESSTPSRPPGPMVPLPANSFGSRG